MAASPAAGRRVAPTPCAQQACRATHQAGLLASMHICDVADIEEPHAEEVGGHAGRLAAREALCGFAGGHGRVEGSGNGPGACACMHCWQHISDRDQARPTVHRCWRVGLPDDLPPDLHPGGAGGGGPDLTWDARPRIATHAVHARSRQVTHRLVELVAHKTRQEQSCNHQQYAKHNQEGDCHAPSASGHSSRFSRVCRSAGCGGHVVEALKTRLFAAPCRHSALHA